MSDLIVGLVCALGSVVLFGTNYLPVKRYDVGDGFFFQWCLNSDPKPNPNPITLTLTTDPDPDPNHPNPDP